MSYSEATMGREAFGRLVVEAPVGVDFAVTKGAFTQVAHGSETTELALPEGIYTVRWYDAGRLQERVVRLYASTKPLHVEYSKVRSDPSPDGAVLPEAGGIGEIGESEGVLLLGTAEAHLRSLRSPAKDFRLLEAGQRRDRALHHAYRERSSGRPLGFRWLEGARADDRAWAAVVAPAGSYVLKYETAGRRTVEQTVQILPRRVTIGEMRRAPTLRPEQQGVNAKLRSRSGIDPTSTIFVSRSIEAWLSGSARGPSRLAAVLRHRLAEADGRVDDRMLEALVGEDDPFLVLYAIVLLIMPACDAGDEAAAPEPGKDRARTLFNRLRPYGNWPDVRCLSWLLGMPIEGRRGYDLEAPPMLKPVWRWTSALSV